MIGSRHLRRRSYIRLLVVYRRQVPWRHGTRKEGKLDLVAGCYKGRVTKIVRTSS